MSSSGCRDVCSACSEEMCATSDRPAQSRLKTGRFTSAEHCHAAGMLSPRCYPWKLARGWRKRLNASAISGFDAGNDLKADAPLKLGRADSESTGQWKFVARCRTGSPWACDLHIQCREKN
jgi:hypothetical protein